MGIRAGIFGCVLLAAAGAEARPAKRTAVGRGGAPAAPTIAAGARAFVAFADRPAIVRLAWAPAAGAVRYRATWSEAARAEPRASGVAASIRTAPASPGCAEARSTAEWRCAGELELSGSQTTFERDERTPGRHRLAVVAIDDAGRESAPAEVVIDVVEITAVAPAAREPQPAARPAFALGARFASDGLVCRLEAGARFHAEAVATQPGATTLACGLPGGPRVEVPVVIAPVVIDAPRPVERGRTATIHVTVASVAPIGPHLVVEPVGAVALGRLARTSHGFDLELTPDATATLAGLVIRTAPASHGAASVILGRVALRLVDAPPPPPPAPAPYDEPAWFALDLGGHAGAFVPPSVGPGATTFGGHEDPRSAVTSAALAGLRLGVFPTRRVGLELEGGYAMGGFADQDGVASLIVARAQLAVRVADERRYGLRLVGGTGAVATLGRAGTSRPDLDTTLHAGAAFTIETRPDLWLRLQAAHVVTAARDAGYASCVEVQVGVMTRIGRRDRW